jgi:hypothetical protein
MAMASAVSIPKDVPTTVKYLAEGSKNERYYSKGIEVNIGKYEDVKVVVRDARPNETEYRLDTSGFTLAKHKSNVHISTNSLTLGLRLLRSQSIGQ